VIAVFDCVAECLYILLHQSDIILSRLHPDKRDPDTFTDDNPYLVIEGLRAPLGGYSNSQFSWLSFRISRHQPPHKAGALVRPVPP
jgi:hypothetical protein